MKEAPVVADNGDTLILYVGHTTPRTERAMFAALVQAMESEPLDPAFNLCPADRVVLNFPAHHEFAAWNGARAFSGNFFNLSRAFRLFTRCQTTIGLLDGLIERNLASPAYRDACAEVERLRQARLDALRGTA